MNKSVVQFVTRRLKKTLLSFHAVNPCSRSFHRAHRVKSVSMYKYREQNETEGVLDQLNGGLFEASESDRLVER